MSLSTSFAETNKIEGRLVDEEEVHTEGVIVFLANEYLTVLTLVYLRSAGALVCLFYVFQSRRMVVFYSRIVFVFHFNALSVGQCLVGTLDRQILPLFIRFKHVRRRGYTYS